ncbi:hypothetical protein ACS0TY_010162 [Phlomoides rotata]
MVGAGSRECSKGSQNLLPLHHKKLRPPSKTPPTFVLFNYFCQILLPKVADLLENAEATMDIDGAHMDLLKKAFDDLEPRLARFLEEARPD